FERGHELVVEELLRALLPVGEPDFESDRPTGRPRARYDWRRWCVRNGSAGIPASLDGALLGLTPAGGLWGSRCTSRAGWLRRGRADCSSTGLCGRRGGRVRTLSA